MPKIDKFTMTVDLLSNMLWNGSAQRKTLESGMDGFLQKTGKAGNRDINCKYAVYDARVVIRESHYSEMQEMDIVTEKLGGIGHELNRWDAAVHDAIVSLYEDGVTEFTVKMVIDVLGGKKSYHRRYTAKQLAVVKETIENLRNTVIKIDASDEVELRVRGTRHCRDFEYSGRLLPAEEVDTTVSGQPVKAYRIDEESGMPMYFYADRKDQIGKADINVINVPLAFSVPVATVTRFLFAEVTSMYSPTFFRRNKILVDTFLKAMEPIIHVGKSSMRMKRADLLDQCEVILNYWKEIGYIKDWSWELKSDGSKKAMLIKLADRTPAEED